MEALAVNISGSKGYDERDSFIPWNNPDNLINFETIVAADNIIYCYFNPVIFCVGIPANVLSCVVFLRQG